MIFVILVPIAIILPCLIWGICWYMSLTPMKKEDFHNVDGADILDMSDYQPNRNKKE